MQSLWLVKHKGKPCAAYPRQMQAKVYASNFSNDADVEIVEVSVVSEKVAPPWVQVSERLPAHGETVLALLKGEFVIADVANLNDDERGFFVRGSFFEWEHASHWMPLPEVPK